MPSQDKRTKGERRRAEILAIARAALIGNGYDAFVLRDIAKQSEMKLGNLQYYFSTREDLLEELARMENQKALEIVSEVGESTGTPSEKIGLLTERLIGQWQKEGGKIFSVVTLLAIHNSRFRRVYLDYYGHFYAAIGDLLQLFEPDASQDAIMQKARLFASLLDGAALQVPLRRGRGSKKERDEFIADVTTALLRILRQSD